MVFVAITNKGNLMSPMANTKRLISPKQRSVSLLKKPRKQLSYVVISPKHWKWLLRGM
ncbi:hypothetical protein PQA65_gp12 [Yersinia phage vB_YenM_42.18]|uniref:Uncharacterized protein n=1 Tax=Yersinia phage vB_YenM_42.18 TaxID=2918926 RepID=A0AAE9FL13_9CAUD|nr:hypothetical protein PQA65_gp12 [Yersinia phage vB_YenM_42.18]UNA05726.1 hypothetical protein vBYenM4218_012 [Yersinia phage vB_YenM_42.18]